MYNSGAAGAGVQFADYEEYPYLSVFAVCGKDFFAAC